MRWVTRSHLHLDRVATCWLIRRFVDPDAAFEFVGWDPDVSWPEDAVPFGLPGVDLGPHDADGTTFEKALRRFGLSDSALGEMAAIITAGVRWALRVDPPAAQTPAQTEFGRTLDGLGGAMGVFNDDDAIVRIALPIYDALYVHCQMKNLDRAVRRAAPRDPRGRRLYWRERLSDPAAAIH